VLGKSFSCKFCLLKAFEGGREYSGMSLVEEEMEAEVSAGNQAAA
jgi:hypothetical protein